MTNFLPVLNNFMKLYIIPNLFESIEHSGDVKWISFLFSLDLYDQMHWFYF